MELQFEKLAKQILGESDYGPDHFHRFCDAVEIHPEWSKELGLAGSDPFKEENKWYQVYKGVFNGKIPFSDLPALRQEIEEIQDSL